MTGSSNTLLEFGNLLNFLAPDEYDSGRKCRLWWIPRIFSGAMKVMGKRVMWLKLWHKLPMTGNGNHTTYKKW